ncbi:MAG TPA: PucR family transcriptional regulator ligand-binding domain-containing protein [Trebonia sp.]|jgi:purine catabolism regulator|nr:PucR family transcriptional regulator ligand-binding domain-containing protein [Trebonia sp.]
MPLTLRDVLALDAVRAGQPAVVAAADRLDTAVRWVHAAEISDVGRLLRGGELVLSTGIALPASAAGLADYIAGLAGAGITGLAIELGQRYVSALPDPLVAAAEARGVPLIVFEREVLFVEITEAVHKRIIDAQFAELQAARRESVQRQAHRMLLAAIIEQPDLDAAVATARCEAMGVPVTGRRLVAVVARLPEAGAWLAAQAAVLDVAEDIASACRDIRVPAVVGSLDDVRAGALLSLPPEADADAPLGQLSARLANLCAARPWTLPEFPVLGVGAPASGLGEARGAFLDAREVADVAIRHPDPGRPFYRLPDLRLRGLLHLLRDDPRLPTFAARELGALTAYDESHGTTLVADLAAYLDAGGNKAVAAARAHLARPTFYQRLRLIEHVLGVSLASAESRTSLHVALLALKPDG